jgi:hypothetical protein
MTWTIELAGERQNIATTIKAVANRPRAKTTKPNSRLARIIVLPQRAGYRHLSSWSGFANRKSPPPRSAYMAWTGILNPRPVPQSRARANSVRRDDPIPRRFRWMFEETNLEFERIPLTGCWEHDL